MRKLMAGHKEFNSKARATQAGNPQKGNSSTTSISHVWENRALCPINTPASYAEPDVTQNGMSLGSAGLSCPVPVTSQAGHPQPPACWGSTGHRAQSWVGLCGHCSATAKPSPCYQCCFQYKSTAPFL